MYFPKRELFELRTVLAFPKPTESLGDQKNIQTGLLVGLANPKSLSFFAAFFPQFIDPTQSMVTQYAVFAVTFIVLESSWLLLYSFLGLRSSQWLQQGGRARLFNKLTGGVFVGAGLLLSTTSRAQS